MAEVAIFMASGTDRTSDVSVLIVQKVSVSVLANVQEPLRPTHRVVEPWLGGFTSGSTSCKERREGRTSSCYGHPAQSPKLTLELHREDTSLAL